MGYISAIETVTEEIMCALGYENYFSGLCAALGPILQNSFVVTL